MIEPTEEELKNGWTAESLTRYIAERQKSQAGIVNQDPDYRERRRPRTANSKYRPHFWRG